MVKRIDKTNEELKIQILTVTTAVMVLATGFKIVYTNDRIDALTLENGQLQDEFQQALDEELRISHENMNNDKNYIVTDEIEVGGRTIKFVTEPTSIPTEAPVQAQEVKTIYDIGYIDYESETYIMAEDGVYHEVESIKKVDFASINEMIDFYCKVFQLNETAVGNKVYEIINEDKESWENYNILNGNEYDSKEQAIARLIADISNFPEEYGLDGDEIASETYELGDWKTEELICKFSVVIGVKPEVAEAIAIGESGPRYDSYNFQTRYNVGGLRRRTGDPHPATSWGLVIYKNPAEGLYRFVTTLKDYFYVDEDSGYDRIVAMSSSYCEDGAYWVNLVGSVYINLEENGYGYYYYMYNDEELMYPTENFSKTI
jgi:hypothetical protein